jgi:pimeloyl-ACP methyl ester carboxylesterase
VYYEYYPARSAGPKRGTLVATEGGPGFSATDSRDEYLALFEPLRADHDVVIMDNRGTGRSGAVVCTKLQTAPTLTIEDIGACGESLGERAALYSTSYATDDLEAILAALNLGPIDLYGNSYGTFFAQVFAARHPGRLRSLILDGAYPLDGPELAWYPAYAPAMRDKFNRACERSPSCSSLPGTSIDHMAPALARLRAHSFAAKGFDVDGHLVHFTAGPAAWAVVLFGAAPPLATLREADAAARAYAAGDEQPILRLMAESTAGVDSRDPSLDPKLYSAGLAAAVTCQDMPQIFDMHVPPSLRLKARDQGFESRRYRYPDAFGPFTLDEYHGMPPDYVFLDECVTWPEADEAHPPAYREGALHGFPNVPVLVISGEFDNMTTVIDGSAAAGQFQYGRQVVLANSFHVNALPHARTPCGAEIARQFIEVLDIGDTECAMKVSAVRLAPDFVKNYRDAAPATALEGNEVGEQGLRLAAAALASGGDLVARMVANTSGHGVGLRGGRFTVRRDPNGLHAVLSRIRWAADLEISGRVDTDSKGDAGALSIEAHGGGMAGHVEGGWPAGGGAIRARLLGTVNGRALIAEAPAP